MKTVGFFGKEKHPDVEAVAGQLAIQARDEGIEVLVESALGPAVGIGRSLAPEEVAAQSDLVVVLGGDGTLIRVVRMLDDSQVPVFGVNLGFLGYLTEFTVEDASPEFGRVLKGDFETYQRVRLEANLFRDGESLVKAKVLNDVVVNVSGMSRIIEIKTEIDDAEVTTYRADGLIVSTPTGSTAYSLSAGGPIVAPGVPAILVTPICPHTLTMRPLVVQAESRICLQVERFTETVQATFDGQQALDLQAGDRLCIEKAASGVSMIKPPRDYFRILRTKLKWGQS
jgi:NAD+ kinase